MDTFELWGDAIEQAWISHTCGVSAPVDTLADAQLWADEHRCPEPTKEG